jgi:hypothetical protein
LNQVCELAKTKFHLQRRLKVFFLLQRMWFISLPLLSLQSLRLLISDPKKNKEKNSNLIHSLSHAENGLYDFCCICIKILQPIFSSSVEFLGFIILIVTIIIFGRFWD